MFQVRWSAAIWGAVLVGGLAQGVSTKSAPAALSDWSVAPPAAALDLDEGLDVRDAQNRPVASAKAKRELRQLFAAHFYTLVLNPVLTQRTSLNDLMRQVWQSVKSHLAPLYPQRWRRNFDVSTAPLRKNALYGGGFLYHVLRAPPDFQKAFRSQGFQISQHLLSHSSILLRL